MSILNDVKVLVEVDIEEEIFDPQLLRYINMGIQYLINNAVPIKIITFDTESSEFTELRDGDYQIVLSWLHLFCLQRFDRTLLQSSGSSSATSNWIENEMKNLIYMLKVVYDVEETV